MTKNPLHLRTLREKAGLSLRELARQINENPSNVSFWERTNALPRADVLAPMAQALGVSIEEILGLPKTKNAALPKGKAGQLFEAISKLPRRQQEKIFDILQPFINEHS